MQFSLLIHYRLKIFHIKLQRYTLNYKMTFYWWNHWFWITCCSVLLVQHQSAIYAMPASFSSLETISTSLKSALVQNENSFQQTSDQQQQQKIATGSKSAPMTFETSDTDDLHGGASEIDAEKIAKSSEWLSTKNESSNTADNKPKFVSVKLEKNVNSPKPVDIIKSFTLSNVNSTNENVSTMPTTMLSSVTDSNAILR